MPVVEVTGTKSYGQQSLVVLTAKPANLEAITSAEIAAGVNITSHMFGDWHPTATTEKVTRSRRMCQTRQAQGLGATTYETPALSYQVITQSVGTAGADGNEAYEALPSGTERYLVQRFGKDGMTDLAATDKYKVWAIETGEQVEGVSQDDAGGEFAITQEVSLLSGYTGPIRGVIAA